MRHAQVYFINEWVNFNSTQKSDLWLKFALFDPNSRIFFVSSQIGVNLAGVKVELDSRQKSAKDLKNKLYSGTSNCKSENQNYFRIF